MIRKHYSIEAICAKPKNENRTKKKKAFMIAKLDLNYVCVCVCLTDHFFPLVLLSWWLLIITKLGLLKMAHQHAAAKTIIFNSILITTQICTVGDNFRNGSTHTHTRKLNRLAL